MADYQLIYNCPGCGKPSKAPEGALTNRCEYCDLVVRIGATHRVLKYFYESKVDKFGARMAADRYLKHQGLPLTGTILKAEFFYLPFYRFRGIALDYLLPQTIFIESENGESPPIPQKEPVLKAKDFDVTIPAFPSEEFGLVSLGIRPQSVPLFCFSREELPHNAVIVHTNITPTHAEDQALKMRENNIITYNKASTLFSAMIGEKLSVIYFPVWALTHEVNGDKRTVLVDGLAKRGYLQTDKPLEYFSNKSADDHSHYIKPLRHQCPNCGADLPDDSFSLFYPCKNCGRSYLINDNGYTETKTLSADSSIVAPYWRFPLELKLGKSYKTVPEFSKILSGEIAFLRKEKRGNKFYLYSPAFRSLDINSWFENGFSMLRTQPHDTLSENLPAKRLVLSIDEAEGRQMAIFLWRRIIFKYSWKMGNKLDLNETDLPSGEIIWLPTTDYKLIKSTMGFKEVSVVGK